MLNRQTPRRNFIRDGLATAVGVPVATLSGGGLPGAYAFSADRDFLDPQISAQIERERTWAFFRSFYDDKDGGNAADFLSHFVQSDQVVYQDAVLNINFFGYNQIAAALSGVINSVTAKFGAGKFSKIFHVTGDMRYGAVAEYVDLKNTFYSTNGITIQTLFDLDGGLVARDTDYWDSAELGLADIIGPADADGVAVPFGAVHPGGVPRSGPAPAPPGSVELARGVTGRLSASAEMLEAVLELHEALQAGSPSNIASLFTEDALYVNPLIHQGPVLYGNYNQTIQVRGRRLIRRLFETTGGSLPDCRGSKLLHVVGGPAGGGFEWKAGGAYRTTGLDRTGLVGCTALDFHDGKIQRMSVKFDTLQMDAQHSDTIRTALLRAGVVDQ